MKKSTWWFASLTLLIGIFIGIALPLGSQAVAQADVPIATQAVSSPSYLDTINAATAAYQNSDFEQAIELAQQAIALDPQRPTAFNLLEQAAIARAGNEYLQTLPPSRYRIDPLHFLANQVNGTQYFIIDVREPDEYAAGHIDGAVNMPLHDLLQHLSELPESKTTPILVYCHTQKRATHALVILRELGYTNVWNLEGGWAAYEEWIANNPMPTPGPTPTPTEEPPSC